MPLALAAGCGAALAVAAVFGAAVVRSSGVYLAMLSLALAQVIWAGATQWVGLTGGDNGLIGLTLVSDEGRPVFYALLVALALVAVAALRFLGRSVMGAALQALRDAPLRASASGLAVGWLKYRIFVESAVLLECLAVLARVSQPSFGIRDNLPNGGCQEHRVLAGESFAASLWEYLPCRACEESAL